MGTSVTTEAIILMGTDVGEEDRILTLFTEAFGLVRAAAGGARRVRSGRPASLDMFVHSRVQIHFSKKAGKLPRIRESEAIDPYLCVRKDYGRVCAASYMAEVVARTTYENDPSPALFHLLRDCLARLDSGQDRFSVLLVFLLRSLVHLGLTPELEKCLRCGETVTGAGVLDPPAGGVIHPTCRVGATAAHGLTAGAVRTLRYICGRPDEKAWSVTASPADTRSLFTAVSAFTHYHAGFEPRTFRSLI